MEEALHPLYHDLVIRPSMLQLLKQILPSFGLELRSNLTLQVFLYRLGVSIVKLRLKTLNLLDAQIVNFRVYLHVLLFGEDNIFVACAQEGFKGDECMLA